MIIGLMGIVGFEGFTVLLFGSTEMDRATESVDHFLPNARLSEKGEGNNAIRT